MSPELEAQRDLARALGEIEKLRYPDAQRRNARVYVRCEPKQRGASGYRQAADIFAEKIFQLLLLALL